MAKEPLTHDILSFLNLSNFLECTGNVRKFTNTFVYLYLSTKLLFLMTAIHIL